MLIGAIYWQQPEGEKEQLSIGERSSKQHVTSPYDGILFSHQKEQDTDT
jgi:hypothetical protein